MEAYNHAHYTSFLQGEGFYLNVSKQLKILFNKVKNIETT